MVSTFQSDTGAANERNEFMLRFVEDIKNNSESLLTRTKEMMNVILQNDGREDLHGGPASDQENAAPGVSSGAKGPEEWLQRLVRMRALRHNHFQKDLFCDPAWDMVLDLTLAHLAGKQISVSSLCVASGVPATTALRRIDDLVGCGLARRLKDPADGRRVFVMLTDEGLKRMDGFLDAVARIFPDSAVGRREATAR